MNGNNYNNTNNEQWFYRQFQSEKLRYSERYRRKICSSRKICSFRQTDKTTSTTSIFPTDTIASSIVFIPDGAFLRKYLTLIEEIINSRKSLTKWKDFKLILLESAAEYMDYRNIIHNGNEYNMDNQCFDQRKNVLKESPAINERNRIIKLCTEHKSDLNSTGVEVIPFPDLTLKDDDEEDNFDLFGFKDMNIKGRSICALERSARWLYTNFISELGDPASSIPSKNIEIIILSNEEIAINDIDPNNDVSFQITVKVMKSTELVSYISNSFITVENDQIQQSMIAEHWMKLEKQCEDEYINRNKLKGITSNSSHEKDRYGHFEYLCTDDLEKGLHQKKFFKGKLKVSSDNFREAYCTIKQDRGQSIQYFLNENNGHFNRAIDGDTVIIEPLPEQQWEQPMGRRWLSHVGNEQDDESSQPSVIGSNDTMYKYGDPMPTAHVVGIYNKTNLRRQFVATLVPKNDRFSRDDNTVIMVPMDSKIPKIRIKTRIDHDRIANKRLLVEIDSWPIDSLYPYGHYVKTIGDVGDLDTEIKCLLIEHKIDLSAFSAYALAGLPQVLGDGTFSLCETEINNRRDLRKSCRIFSVDPQGCQDIDDAMHAKVLDSGDIEIGVHIADVTHFVKLHSALDREAAKRGTTFYLVDRRFDMLPSLLSSNLCSLHGNMDRYAVSVIWTLTPDLESVKSTWYGRTVIHNIQAMTYEQADNILHNKEPDDPKILPPPLTAGTPVDRSLVKDLKNDLIILTELARKLRKRRETRGGAVDLSSGDRGSELKFILDENGRPTKVEPKKELEIHHTIAELMIMSNAFVAETIFKHYPDNSILRIHQKADLESFEELEKLLSLTGIHFDGNSNKALANTLKAAKSDKRSLRDPLFQSLATRAMSEAQYICTGALEEGIGFSHYGLGIEMYCHFTSPIRRYADIAVHRLLLSSLSHNTDEVLSQNVGVMKNTNILPESSAISILSGDRLKINEEPHNTEDNELSDDFLDSLIEGASAQVFANDPEKKKTIDNQSILYKTTELARICHNLNQQNRAAKRSSMDCQRLFLSLYFKDNIEITQAVIIGLRQNGLIVYIPKFDIKGPVYLVDRNGCVQINPKTMDLPTISGLPPSKDFMIIDGCRMFPHGKCTIINGNDTTKANLEVSLPFNGTTRKAIFKYLDVITVQVSCDLSNTTARIPSPKIHLVSKTIDIDSTKSTLREQNNEKLKSKTEVAGNFDEPECHVMSSKSIFQILSDIKITPMIEGPFRLESNKQKHYVKGRVQTLQGRIHFGGFKESQYHYENRVNESNIMTITDYAKQGNYDASRQIERDATSRIQRKAAEKRNTRRSKRS